MSKPFYQDDELRLWFPKNPAVEIEKDITVSGKAEPLENPALKVWDKVSPKHYKDVVPGYEYMDVMEHALGFEGTVEHLRGQIFKYLMRFGKKDDRLLESGKIAWYANRLHDVFQRNIDGQFPITPENRGLIAKPKSTPTSVSSPTTGTANTKDLFNPCKGWIGD